MDKGFGCSFNFPRANEPFPIHPRSAHQCIMANAKKFCLHIHGRAFFVNEIKDLSKIENALLSRPLKLNKTFNFR